MGNHVGRSPIVNQPGKVAGMARQYENDVIDTQPSKGRPLPHNETNHVDRTPVMSRHPSRQASQESPMARRSKDGSYHSTPGSGGHSHHSIQSKGSRKGGPPEMCETATSPDGSYHGHERITKEFEVDYPIVKPAPKQKTKIVYDLGSPQMNTQGINASIPVTTDKYTYTITSVLSSMSHQQNDSPLSSPTSGSKRPISSYKIIQPNPNPKIGNGGYMESAKNQYNRNNCNSYNNNVQNNSNQTHHPNNYQKHHNGVFPKNKMNQEPNSPSELSPMTESNHRSNKQHQQSQRHGKDGRGGGCGNGGCNNSGRDRGCQRGDRGGPSNDILSPIQDVSPSLEAAEQESMNRMQGRHRSQGHHHQGSSSKDGAAAGDSDIAGMLSNFSKALDDIREIREKRMQSLGPGQEKQSPTMDGWNRLMSNIPQTGPRNQQAAAFSQNQPFQNQQNASGRMMQQSNQPMNQSNSRPGNSWANTMNMVRTNVNNTGYSNNDMSGYNNSYDNSYPQQQSLTYPSNFPNQPQGYQQQSMDQMQQQIQQQPQQLQQQPQPLVVQQQQQQPIIQSLPPMPQQQSLQYYGGSGLVQQPVQYISAAGQTGAQVPSAGGQNMLVGQSGVAGPPLVMQQQMPQQNNPSLVNPNQIIYQASNSQNSYMQPPQQPQGGLVTGGPPMVISATPAPGAAPAPVVIPQPAPVQLVSQPAPAPVVIQYSGGGHDTSMMAPTPALISAPTPAPILMNNTAPNHPPPTVVSSNAPLYSFDPSGLTPAQQLAYAQAQQQHQQQHLKKMRQRLPHVSGRELHGLHKQIKDLQHKQHLQTLQTLRLAQGGKSQGS